MSRFSSIILTFLVINVLAFGQDASSKQTSSTEQLVVGIEAEPERFDPLTMKNPKDFIVSWQIYEGLLGLDNNGNIRPVLAEKWETSDNQVWRFHLRKGVRFHASVLFGTPAKSRLVTAQDVVASYTAFCSPAAYPAFLLMDSLQGCADCNAGKKQNVEGIRALDENTVEIRLLKPEPFFLNRLTTSWISIFPHEALESRYKDTWGLTLAVGTGPYRMLSRSNTEIVLERNPEYRDKTQEGTIGRLTFRVIKNDQVRLIELKKGGIDLMLISPTLYPTVLEPNGLLKPEYAGMFRTKVFKTYNSHMIGINSTKVSDVHLRRALNYGVDRKQIVDKLLYGHAEITGGTVPPGINGYKSPFVGEELFNPTLAREELAKSDYKGEPIELLVHDQFNSELIGQLFQDQMKALGINIQLTKMDFNSLIGRMVKGETSLFSMFIDYVFSSPEPILINMFSSSKRPVPNFWQFSDPSVDADLEGLRTLKHEEALKQSATIERRIMDQVPGLFLFRLEQVVLYSNRFGSLSVNPHGYFDFGSFAPMGN